MNDLDYKFRKNSLTAEELLQLRKEVNDKTDEQVGELLQDSWFKEEIDISTVPDDRIDRLKEQIDRQIGKDRRSVVMSRLTRIAAIILLPVFIVATVYLYRENKQIVSEELVMATGKYERANISLPDGTSVSLNEESKLSYNPKLYNLKERTIGFEGEAYFRVHKDEKLPFIIDAKGIQVKVLGTVFNLSVRANDKTAEISVEEGSVSLLSVKSRKNTIIKANQTAVLDQATGDIRVITDENVRDASAWQRGDMVFRNTAFPTVIRTIEENYGVEIIMHDEFYFDDNFSGTIPATDLNEVLEIIEKSYHVKAVIQGKKVYLSAE